MFRVPLSEMLFRDRRFSGCVTPVERMRAVIPNFVKKNKQVYNFSHN
jgi:hypothetical protein